MTSFSRSSPLQTHIRGLPNWCLVAQGEMIEIFRTNQFSRSMCSVMWAWWNKLCRMVSAVRTEAVRHRRPISSLPRKVRNTTWDDTKTAAEALLEEEAIDHDAVLVRVEQLLEEAYPRGLAAEIALDPNIASKIPAQRRDLFKQAVAEQPSELRTAYREAERAVRALESLVLAQRDSNNGM